MFKKILAAGFCAFFSVSSFATDSIYPATIVEEIPIVWASIITLSGGAAWTSPGQNQFFNTVPFPYIFSNNDFYTHNTETETLGTGEIFFGLQRFIYPNIMGQLGLGVAGTTNASITGSITSEGIVDAYGYSYKVNHARLELKGKLISHYFQMAQPYISASFGAGFNHAHDYAVTPIFPPPVVPWFRTDTVVSLPYSIGAGLQTMITRNWQVGVGYQFADLGRSILHNTEATATIPPIIVFTNTTGLRLNHLYTNEVQLSLSYLFLP